mgnify:FL=1
MKYIKAIILFGLIFINCDDKVDKISNDSVGEINIPSIEKNILNQSFKYKMGILYFNNKPYSGVVNEFYENESLKSKSEYYNGKREGDYFGWYANGSKWFQRFYSKGIKVKTHKGWFKNGQQMFEYQINNKGVYDGFVKDWHLNGQIAKHFNFLNGKETGSQKMWKPNGKIRANFYTVEGERFGLIGLKNCVSVLSKNKENEI